MKKILSFLLAFVMVFGAFALAACEDLSLSKITVTFKSNDGKNTEYTQSFERGVADALTPNEFERDGYTFTGWNTAADGSDKGYGDGAQFESLVSLSLYAQWVVSDPDDPDEFFSLIYNANGGVGVSISQEVKKGQSATLKENIFTKAGSTFNGWNTQADGQGTLYAAGAEHTFSGESDITLYAVWIPDDPDEYFTLIYNANGGVGVSVSQKVEKGHAVTLKENIFTKAGSTFNGWNTQADGQGTLYAAGTEHTFSGESDITLYAVWIPSVVSGDVLVSDWGGGFESAYAEWASVAGAAGYSVYYKLNSEADSAYVKTDAELVRGERVDLAGLKGGATYDIKIAAVLPSGLDSDTPSKVSVSVLSHDRSGFAFTDNSPNKTSSGAYSEDGTLKNGAQVIYITNSNKDTVTLSVTTSNKGAQTECIGLTNILKAREKGIDKTPLSIRFIGRIDPPSGVDSNSLLNIKKTFNITVEGIGEDALIYGFGFNIRECNNVEVRNLAFHMFPDDSVSIQTRNRNIWIHNNDFMIGKNMGGDKALGDGSCDIKADSSFITVSYNHFQGTGKSSLVGLGESAEFFVTFHHNYFDESGSRHPRIRTGSIHVYNNYFKGVKTYGIGAAEKSSIFVEWNYFEKTNRPMIIASQGSDMNGGKSTLSGENGGAIKQVNNYMDEYTAGTFKTEDATLTAVKGGGVYNNFENTFDSIGYNYALDEDWDTAREKVVAYAGRYEKLTLTAENQIEQFGNAVAAIGEVEYTDVSLGKINLARKYYEAIADKSEISAEVVEAYNTAVQAYNTAAAQSVETRIAALPDAVLLEHCAQIFALKAEYKNLSQDIKDLITNIARLEAAADAADILIAGYLTEEIGGLPEVGAVTLGDAGKINALYDEYELLTEEQRLLIAVSAREKLEAVKERCDYLYAPYAVIDMINAVELPITLQSGGILELIGNMFDELEEGQKELVSNYQDYIGMLNDYWDISAVTQTVDFNELNKKWAEYKDVYGDFFTVASTSNDLKALAAGDYQKGLKMDSKTSVTFTVTKPLTLTVICASSSGEAKLSVTDGGAEQIFELGDANTVKTITVEIAAGTYTVASDAKEIIIYVIQVG